jgi:IPT/TIG domain
MAITWTESTYVGGPTLVNACAWSPTKTLYVAVGSGAASATNNIITSADGVTWTVQTSVSDTWGGVVWSPGLALFVAVSIGGSGNVITSPDGVNWTTRTASEANHWTSITWATFATPLLVAVASNGVHRVMTSPDGTNWTNQTAAAANSWESVIWTGSLLLATAAGAAGTHLVMTSTDSVTWASQTTPSTSSIGNASTSYTVAWSPTLSLFAAPYSADAGATFDIITSPDGVTWTAHALPEGSATLFAGILWDSIEAQFVLFGNAAGNNNSVFTSPDGINWTANNPGGFAQNWEAAVVYAASIGAMLAFNIDTARKILVGTLPLSISSLTPTTGTRLGGTVVTISGSGFVQGLTVTFGGVLGTVLSLTATTITVLTPPGVLGTVNVVVTNPSLTSVTLTNGFTYVGGQWLIQGFDLKPHMEQTS